MPSRPTRTGTIERFWIQVEIPDNLDVCWLWKGHLSTSGYGRIRSREEGREIQAHRLSWQIHYGGIPEGLYVLHKCDIRPCVNPRHLFLGTQSDNILDMVKKGRFVKGNRRVGEQHQNSKMTMVLAAQMRTDRQLGITLEALAEKYNVSVSSVVRVIYKGAWA